jgi:hypothetical protein
MSFLTREERYDLLYAIKRGDNPRIRQRALTKEESWFVQEFDVEKFDRIMQDPEVVAVMQRLRDR